MCLGRGWLQHYLDEREPKKGAYPCSPRFVKRQLIIRNQLSPAHSVHFEWSPDGKTVYAEHDVVPNGAVFNVENHEGLPAYK